MGLRITGLTKTYRRPARRGPGVVANDDVSIAIEPGEVFGLLGHNGAGKTTLVNQVVGLLAPDRGSIVLDGIDLIADPGAARRLCSLQPQAQLPLGALSPRLAIDLIGQLRGGDRRRVESRREALVEALDIGEWRDVESEKLSGGVKRLTAFAMAAVEPGRVVVLDEPTNDVDPVRRRLLWTAVRDLADDGAAVLLVTHNVAEAERVVDRLAILENGRVVTAGTPAELRRASEHEVRVDLRIAREALPPPMPPFVSSVQLDGQRLVASVPSDRIDAAAAWAVALRDAGTVDRYSLSAASLEDIYVDIADGADRAAASMDPVTTPEAEHVRAA